MATQNYFKVKNGLEFPSIETLQTTDNGGPSVKPSLNLDFAKTKQLDPRITFTRASTATYYDGKTNALAEQNLISASVNLGTPYQSVNNTLTNNVVVSPDGSTTASLLVPNTTAGRHYCSSPMATATPINTPSTASVYVKSAGHNFVHVQFSAQYGSGGSRYGVTFDLLNGTINGYSYSVNVSNTSSSITYIANGWYRVTLTATMTTTPSSPLVYIQSMPSASASDGGDGLPSYAGDGTNGVYVWGFQIEQRSYATAYTPTTASPITNYIPVLQTATTNTARFDHDPVTGESKGLLIEEARTNLIQGSSEFYANSSGANVWLRDSIQVASNVIIAPDGTLTASKLYQSKPSIGAGASQTLYSSVANSTVATFSAFFKKGEMSLVGMGMYGGATSLVFFDLNAGNVAGSYGSTLTNATITPVGNGWYRCSVTSTDTSGNTPHIILAKTVTASRPAYTGDNYSGVYVWGTQYESGAFATSYIPTTLTYFGRGSNASYKGANGIIQTAASNVVRYESTVLGGSNILLEPASSNTLTYSEYYTGVAPPWNYQGATGVSNAGFAPDGSNKAIAIIENGASSSRHGIYRNSMTVSAGTNTVSVYLKAGLRSAYTFVIYGDAISGGKTPGNLAISSGIDMGNGWYRCSYSFTANSASNNTFFEIWPATAAGGDIYYTGTNGATAMYVWGLQCEAGFLTSYIPSIETHTGRSSTATYYDSTGTIRTAASGQQRYTYNPSLLSAAPKLLLEPAATNLLLQSEALDNASWAQQFGVGVTANAAAAPDGNNTARLLTCNTSGQFQRVLQVPTVTGNTFYTTSVYVKKSTSSVWAMELTGNGGADGNITAIVTYNFDTNALTSNNMACLAYVQAVGNGWYRVSASMKVNSTNTNYYVYLYATTPAGSTGATYVWGAQVEAGYAASSYIPTTSATVTRAADTSTSAAQSRAADTYSSSQVTRAAEVVKISGSNFLSWYRQDQGTLYAEANVGNGLFPYIYGLTDGTDTNRHILYRISGTASRNTWFDPLIGTNGVSQTNSGAIIPSTATKFSHAFKTNDVADAGDGVIYQTDSSVTLPNVNQLYLGSNGFTFFANGHIKKFAFYPKRLTNAELISITS